MHTQKTCFVVQTTREVYLDGEQTIPVYLDGFRSGGAPVWKSNLQDIDPYIKPSAALRDAARAQQDETDPVVVREIGFDEEGRFILLDKPPVTG